MTTIGILGAGQLGRMLALAGYPLGLRFRFFDSVQEAPAYLLADHVIADYADEAALKRFVDGLDVVTYEFENVPVETARLIEQFVPVYPPPRALEKGQDRLVEKSFFRELGIPTPRFSNGLFNGLLTPIRGQVGQADESGLFSGILTGQTDESGQGGVVDFPAVLKTRRMGYDGKGQFVVRNADELARALKALEGQPPILEEFILFEREVSIIGVRSKAGEMAFYPLVENTHREGILRCSIVDNSNSEYLLSPLQTQAESYCRAVMTALNCVGVLAIEFFVKDGELLANEMAPRVHNSGHWTIEGAVTSQFENHVRAVTDRPLGSTRPRGACAMVNIIGALPDVNSILKIEGAHLHLYDKAPRPGRKIGHVTVVENDREGLLNKVERIQNLLIG